MHASTLNLSDNRRIAYHKQEGNGPCVVFLGGFKSDMTGAKATAIAGFCAARGQAFIRFDYTGHGQSSGKFIDGTIGAWKQDALDVIDQLTEGKVILIGSSLGAWLMLLVASERRERIAGLVGIAAAPDFTEALIWEKLTADQQRELLEKGVFYAPSCYGEEPYPITRQLIEEARGHLLLGKPIAVDAPVRLIHGTLDADVPWQRSVLLMDCLPSPDVRLTLVKGGDHRLSQPEQLALLCGCVAEFLPK